MRAVMDFPRQRGLNGLLSFLPGSPSSQRETLGGIVLSEKEKSMGVSFRTSRRSFLKTSSAAVALPYIITTKALGDGETPPASERIVMGGIGIGNMGRGDMGAFLGRPDVQYVAVCDVRKSFREQAKANVDKHYQNGDCKAYNDFRDVLARTDIDAVHVATPDHWHAIIVIEATSQGGVCSSFPVIFSTAWHRSHVAS